MPLKTQIDRPATDAPAPCAIICHGLGDEHAIEHPIYSALAASLVEAGFVAVRVSFDRHRDSKGVCHFTIDTEQEDLVRTVLQIRAKAFVDEKRICLVGHSMGGLGVLLHAAKNQSIKAVASLSPVFDMGSGYGTTPEAFERLPPSKRDRGLRWQAEALSQGYFLKQGNTSGTYKLGKEWLDTNFSYTPRLPSIFKRISCPVLVVWGSGATVDDQNAKRTVATLRFNGKQVETCCVKGADHSYQNVDSGLTSVVECVKGFLLENA